MISGGGISPHVNPVVGTRDPVTLEQVYVLDETRKDYLEFLVEGYSYKLFGLIPTSTHLIGVEGGDTRTGSPYWVPTSRVVTSFRGC